MDNQKPLTGLAPGHSAVIAALPQGRHLNKLLAFGLLPGVEVEVLQVFPVYVLSIGYTKLAIDRQIAAGISVIRLVK